jgi:hypothetical protein
VITTDKIEYPRNNTSFWILKHIQNSFFLYVFHPQKHLHFQAKIKPNSWTKQEHQSIHTYRYHIHNIIYEYKCTKYTYIVSRRWSSPLGNSSLQRSSAKTMLLPTSTLNKQNKPKHAENPVKFRRHWTLPHHWNSPASIYSCHPCAVTELFTDLICGLPTRRHALKLLHRLQNFEDTYWQKLASPPSRNPQNLNPLARTNEPHQRSFFAPPAYSSIQLSNY